ncbi:unnamed protein product [Lactuca virosa]|uniref:Uncharacterized protein n=1 Tax=Lactuca virosa TaxID=75947 RepID=A0AAU9MJ88_9ASTR|nr:unnamed protein product [Lactuca virosa]
MASDSEKQNTTEDLLPLRLYYADTHSHDFSSRLIRWSRRRRWTETQLPTQSPTIAASLQLRVFIFKKFKCTTYKVLASMAKDILAIPLLEDVEKYEEEISRNMEDTRGRN